VFEWGDDPVILLVHGWGGRALQMDSFVLQLISVGLTALFGLLHGYAHGAEIPGTIEPAAYAFGFLASTAALHLTGIALGVASRGRFVRLAQTLGVIIAASGMWMLSTIKALRN
jgi:hydrogenase/urease accessory protein HupE